MPSIAAFPASTQERLTTPVSDLMRPGVITIGDRASLLQAKRAITEPPHFIEPGAIARHALEMLEKPGVSRLLVRAAEGGVPQGVVPQGVVPQGVVAPLDLVELVTRPS